MRSLFVSFREKPSHGSSSGRLGKRQPYGSNLSRDRKGYFPYNDDCDSHALQSVSTPSGLLGEDGLSHAIAYPEKAIGEESDIRTAGNQGSVSEENSLAMDNLFSIKKTTEVEVTYNEQ